MDDVKFIFNYDFRNFTEDYWIRNTCTTHTFLTQKDGKNALNLINILKETNQMINHQLYEMDQTSIRQWNRPVGNERPKRTIY